MTNSVKSYDDYVWRATMERRPLVVMFELTYNCNLKCEYCYNVTHAPSGMSTKEAIFCLDELKRIGVLKICFTGGEPLLRKDFFEILDEAQKRQFLMEIVTNATLIDKKIAERFKRYPIIKIQTSIHGACAETHERESGVPGSFEKLLRALEYLKDGSHKTVLACTVTRHNQEELKEIKAIADRYGCVVRFNLNVVPRIDGDRKPLLSGISPDFRCKYWSAEYDCVRDTGNPALEQRTFPPGKPNCNAGITLFTIDPEGNIFPCNLWRRQIGNIIKDDIKELWENSPTLKEIRSIVVRIPHEVFSDEERPFSHDCPGLTEQITGNPMTILDEERIDIQCIQKRASELKGKRIDADSNACEKL